MVGLELRGVLELVQLHPQLLHDHAQVLVFGCVVSLNDVGAVDRHGGRLVRNQLTVSVFDQPELSLNFFKHYVLDLFLL